MLITQDGKGGKERGEIIQLVTGGKLVLLPGSFNPLHEGRISILLPLFSISSHHFQFSISIFKNMFLKKI
jgi:hypothetical protein